MGKKKSKSNLILRWGVTVGLIGFYLMNQSSETFVQANESRTSHIGLFDGETTFSLSSDTGILPTLELETKDVYGNTEKYESGSGEITIPESNSQATIKSAILKGNTLVNIVKKQEKPFSHSADNVLQNDRLQLNHSLKANTTYTRYIHVSALDLGTTSNVLMCDALYGEDGSYSQYYYYVTSKGWIINTFTPKTTSISPYLINPDMNAISNGLNYIEIDKFMIIEGDYTNVDIPYFEGMQSVKMPVLTIFNEDGFQTATISIEEDITLRSNGEVYDELDLMTGKLTQRIGEDGSILNQPMTRLVKINTNGAFEAVNQASVSMVGTVKPTIASLSLPTDPLSFVLDPNEDHDKQFIASEFSIMNDSQASLTIELKEFVQTTNIFNDVLPDHYESWDNLNKEESKAIALGLVPQESENWLTLNSGTYYVADSQNKMIGRVKRKSTVDFKFVAQHGQSFDDSPTPQYKLTFIFEL